MKKISLVICALLIIPFLLQAADKPGSNKKAYFVHHSTGEIYRDGGMETKLEEAGYDLTAPWWDGNTDPVDMPGLFQNSASWDIFNDAGVDIIIFKSCYPASDITSATMLNEYKDYYRQLYDIYQQHPDILFVPMSTPPLPKGMTSYSNAKLAKKFDKWLTHNYVTNYSGDNLLPFRLHLQLRNNNGYLKSKYVADPFDGHPNSSSGIKVGNKLVKRLNIYFQ